MKISGARVLVTGAGSGIGKATALRCARSGASVVAVDINAQAARAVADECGGEFRECDVSDAPAVARLAQEVGDLDVLVNNAGVGVGGPFLEAKIEDWHWLRGVNLDGVLYGCHEFGSRMVARGRGQIVNVASGAGYIPSSNMAMYCASKAAVISLSQCLRADWHRTGVGVSVICPGLINTPIPSHSRMYGSVADKQERVQRIFRRGHSPDLVARAIVSAVEENRELVPVGFESQIAYGLMRFMPGRVRGLIARAQTV